MSSDGRGPYSRLLGRCAELRQLHADGLTNRRIAEELGVHHRTVAYHLKKLDLEPNGSGPKKIEMVDESHARCSKCGAIKDIGEFLLNRRNAKSPYRLSYCNDCLRKQRDTRLDTSIEIYMRDRLNRVRLRSAKLGILCDLDLEYLLARYETQQGLCFYTDTKMEWKRGGIRPNSMSFDKVIPSFGYTKGNVVLCTNRINTVKSDLTLDEMAAWMPGWYERIRSHLKEMEGNF